MPTYPSLPIPGVDKQHGRHIAYITVTPTSVGSDFPVPATLPTGAAALVAFYCWTSISSSDGIELKENTNPGALTEQLQAMRMDPPQFEISTYLPYDSTEAAANAALLQAGVVLAEFNVFDANGNSAFPTGYLADFGSWIIEESTFDFTKSDFATVKARVVALGYTNAATFPALPTTNI